MGTQRETGKGRRGDSPVGAVHRPWSREVCVAAARAVVDDGLTAREVSRRFGVPYTTLLEWSRKYRAGGEAQLLPAGGRRQRSSKWNASVPRAAIVAAKRTDPAAGSRRIRDVLKRYFGLGTSATTVLGTTNASGSAPTSFGKDRKT